MTASQKPKYSGWPELSEEEVFYLQDCEGKPYYVVSILNRRHMHFPTAWFPMWEKFISLLHGQSPFVCLGHQKISEDRIPLARLKQCPDPTEPVRQK